jgi:hypothetical protein
MTSTATAFSGCAGIGMPYSNPVRICMAPNIVNTLAGSSFAARIIADHEREICADVAERAGHFIPVESDAGQTA